MPFSTGFGTKDDKVKRILFGAAILFSALLFFTAADGLAIHAGEEGALREVRVGVVTDGPGPHWSDLAELFRQEGRSVAEGQFDMRFPAEFQLDGGWTVAGIEGALDRLLAEPSIDIVLALGYVSSHRAALRPNLPKAVVAPFIINARAQGLSAEEAGRENLSYIEAFSTLRRDVQTFQEVVPFTQLEIVVDELLIEGIPELVPYARVAAGEEGLENRILQVTVSASEALGAISPGADAVMITPLPRFSREELERLIDGLIERRLPSYATEGRAAVEAGILASMMPRWTMESLARQAAVNLLEIARGTAAVSMPTAFDPGQQFTINMATARAVGVYPSLTILTMADLLHEERTDIERVVSLEGAVAEALDANLNLSALEKGVSAGAEAVREARSRLLPQINLTSDAVAIDDDRAGASGGTAPENSWRGSINGSQVIWSEQVRSGYDVQKRLQLSLEESFEAFRLDVIRAAAVSYLNVLRAGTLEQILKDNLKLTRANLERARVRVSVGIAGPEEVYRWESQVAEGRAQVLQAESETLNAKAALNRLLNRPLEEEFLVHTISLDDQVAALMGSLYGRLIDNPRTLKVFRRFLVGESMTLSPELRRFDAEISAAERQVKAAGRAFWLPDFSLRGGVTELLAEDGEGQRADSPLGLDDTEWSVGVFAELPIFNSGGKKATLERRREELKGLSIEREGEAQRITTEVVTTVNLTRASYPAIRLSDDAAEAAGKNLELVTDSYERGIKSIIDLLDAQNQAIVSNQKAANSAYDFLVDLMGVERSVGRFFFLLTEQERREWLGRFEEYAKAEGIKVSPP